MHKRCCTSNIMLVVLSAGIGFYGLSTEIRFSTLILAIPVFWILADSRYSAFAVVLAYKLFASGGLLQGAAVFLSESHTPLQAAMLYFFLSFAASLLFLVFWSRDSKATALCIFAAMCFQPMPYPRYRLSVLFYLLSAACGKFSCVDIQYFTNRLNQRILILANPFCLGLKSRDRIAGFNGYIVFKLING